ncbi:MAG: hypothetical protein CME64_03445 [Halobacteriovoraceae bacterium]|nr:hypothetical protein [Halobacteriovoraceae bacterium]
MIKYYRGINSNLSNRDILSPPAFDFFVHEHLIKDNSLFAGIYKNLDHYIAEIKKRKNLLPKEHRDFILNYYRLCNLFSDLSNHELEGLKDIITAKSKDLIHELGLNLKITDHHAWLNLLNSGEQATRHCHVVKGEQSISWVLFADDSDTLLNLEAPHFIHEEDKVQFNTYIKIRPQKGKLIFFPSWMFHFTNIHKGKTPRLSIAGKVILTH